MHIFVADAHLSPGRADRMAQEALVAFLGQIGGRATSLFILGDLFEFWFEYRTVVPKHYLPVLLQLGRLVDAGVQVVYVPGNHDAWLGETLERTLGIAVTPPVHETNLDGRRALLAHGDTFDTSLGARLGRAMLRNRVDIVAFSLLHPDLGTSLARLVAGLSRKLQAGKCRPYLLAQARRQVELGYDLVVLAHSHRAQCERIGRGWYMNVGQWRFARDYGIVENGLPRLARFAP